MRLDEVLTNLVEKENKEGLDAIRVSGVPVWNHLKYDIRRRYFFATGICDSVQSSKGKILLKESVKGMLSSFFKVHKQLLFPSVAENFIMGFSRLDRIDDLYLDRFVDPVIDLTQLKESYICFEYGRVGIHHQPRKNLEHVIYTDYIYMLSFLCSYLLAFFFMCANYQAVYVLKKKIHATTSLTLSPFWLSRKIVEFKLNAAIFSLLLSRSKAKRVFGVSRILFRHVSYAAKKKKIPVFEFQHGITLGTTELYSGNYVPEIDPDYFLLFGDSCPKTVFGIPESKTIIIGWAFKDYLKGIASGTYQKDSCLVVSEPQITNQVISATLLLAEKFPNIQFHIRRHPQESFSEEQKKRFENVPNVIDATNKRNSTLVAMTYDYIIGENSTVLFEGLSLGKKVARLNICGLQPVNRSDDDAFYYIDNVEDFGLYLNAPVKQLKEKVYSDFNAELFNSFLER